jgi:hypothetical protein
VLGLVASIPTLALAGHGPILERIFPLGVRPGETSEVRFEGRDLHGGVSLWSSFAAEAAFTPANAADEGRALKCRLTIPASAPVGVGAVRLFSDRGVSSWRLLLIDDLPGVAASGTNHTVATAQRLELPIAVDGACAESRAHFYRFGARKGQRVSVEVVAQRLGSALDPVIRLLDGGGRELAFNNDAPGLGGDARLNHVFTASGDHVLELRDSGFQGGSGHFYRLRLGDFPAVSAPFPPAIQAGTAARVEFAGWALHGVKPAEVPAPPEPGRLPLGVPAPDGHGSALANLRVTALPEQMEAEPNDTRQTATRVVWPGGVSGRFLTARDRDCFEFEATKGERLRISGRTRSLGSPSELFLRLLNPDGSVLAESNPTTADEGVVTNSIPAGGAYVLQVEELNRLGGPEHVYRIEIERDAGFSLQVETDHVEATPNGSFDLKVSANRRDHKGPITLTLHGLDAAFAVANDVIAKGKSETALKVTVPAQLPRGTVRHFRVTGAAPSDGPGPAVPVSTAPALRQLFPQMRSPLADLDGLIALGVTAPAVRSGD